MTLNSGHARSAILKRIGGGDENATGLSAEYSSIPREYTRSGALVPEERLRLFEDRLKEYDATVYHAAQAALPETIAQALDRRGEMRGGARIAIPRGLPSAWLPLGFSFVVAEDLSAPELDRLGGVLTGCAVAIAATGTIVLQNAPGQGARKLSLVPDYHLCIVNSGQVVETVPEAFRALAPTKTLPTTFISGPSATADIEMTRIKGVHGPRFLEVILVSDQS